MASLLAVPAILGAVMWLLVDVSPWLAVAAGAAFVFGLQAALARRWTSLRPKPVSPQDAPELHAVVERLCTAGGLRKPRIVVHEKHYANSWIRGLTAKRTTLHLTSRLLELLDESQLEAVIAHELSHVGQKDAILMSAVGSPVAAMLDGARLYFHAPIGAIRATRAIGTLHHRPTEPSLRGLTPTFVEQELYLGIVWLFLLPIGVLFVVIGSLCRAITAYFSRARELEADAGAAQLTGNPSALASALMLITETPPDTVPQVDLRRATSLDVFHIVAIGKEYPLLHTHPSLRRRLRQLSDLEKRLQEPPHA